MLASRSSSRAKYIGLSKSEAIRLHSSFARLFLVQRPLILSAVNYLFWGSLNKRRVLQKAHTEEMRSFQEPRVIVCGKR